MFWNATLQENAIIMNNFHFLLTKQTSFVTCKF